MFGKRAPPGPGAKKESYYVLEGLPYVFAASILR